MGELISMERGDIFVSRLKTIQFTNVGLAEQLFALMNHTGHYSRNGKTAEFTQILNALVSAYPEDKEKILKLISVFKSKS